MKYKLLSALSLVTLLSACSLYDTPAPTTPETFPSQAEALYRAWEGGCKTESERISTTYGVPPLNCSREEWMRSLGNIQSSPLPGVDPAKASTEELVMLSDLPTAERTWTGAFPEGQCTWFVAEEWKRLYGDDITRFVSSTPRDAKIFPQMFEREGYLVDTIPSIGSIAVYTDGTFAEYGHVAIVRAIYGDTLRVKQSNYPDPLKISEQDYDVKRATAYVHPNGEKRLTLSQGVTSYNPEVAQNDSDPRTGAAGVRMRDGMMALSRDLLAPTKAHPEWTGQIPYGTIVTLSAPGYDARCNASYEVQDTMNKRFTKKGDVFREHRSDNFSCPSGTSVIYHIP